MRFRAIHRIFDMVQRFTDVDAPDWLTSESTIKGSTMDDRWFFTDHVLTLKIGQSVNTDFWHIERIE